MIRYKLRCHKDHEFEAWFGSSSAYDKQAKRGLVTCPDCGSKKVQKALMTPGVSTRSSPQRVVAQPEPREAPEGSVSMAANVPPALAAQHNEMQQQFLALMRQVRKEVEAKAEYVGPKFADEARKIHLKEAEARGIWGEATLEEARELSEEGIDCLPLPRLPEDQN